MRICGFVRLFFLVWMAGYGLCPLGADAGVVITEFGTTGQEGLGSSSRKIEERQGVLPVCGRDRAVLDFDLSGLPTDSVVLSARLRAFLVRRASAPEIATFSVSALGRDV